MDSGKTFSYFMKNNAPGMGRMKRSDEFLDY